MSKLHNCQHSGQLLRSLEYRLCGIYTHHESVYPFELKWKFTFVLCGCVSEESEAVDEASESMKQLHVDANSQTASAHQWPSNECVHNKKNTTHPKPLEAPADILRAVASILSAAQLGCPRPSLSGERNSTRRDKICTLWNIYKRSTVCAFKWWCVRVSFPYVRLINKLDNISMKVYIFKGSSGESTFGNIDLLFSVVYI